MLNQLRFDGPLSQIRSDQLKRIAAAWGHGSLTRKEPMLHAITKSLADPKAIRKFVDQLEPYERAILAFIKRNGGVIQPTALLSSLRAAGYPVLFNTQIYSDDRFIARLIDHGLVLTSYPGDPGTYYGNEFYGHGLQLFCDGRILEAIDRVDFTPISLLEQPAPAVPHTRRPQGVLLDILAITQAIEQQGGLQINRNGTIRANDMRRLAKTLGWESEQIFDGLPFRYPTDALLDAMLGANLLAPVGNMLQLSQPGFPTEQPIESVVERLVQGFCRLAAWVEANTIYFHESLSPRYNSIRNALLIALSCIPTEQRHWMSPRDLGNVLYQRIGEYHSLTGMVIPLYFYGRQSEEEKRHMREQRSTQLRASWEKNEQSWLGNALTSWLYFLGIVEVGIENKQLVSFRLTPFGMAVLHPHLRSAAPEQTSGPAWTIQPDFEVLVYLEQTSASQIGFIERIAERVQSAAHVARYRLTRDSIYQALERNTTLAQISDGLTQGAGGSIPQNVLASVRDWASQRDRLTLRRHARLLEYTTEQQRDEALSNGIAGTPLGDRFVLLTRTSGRLPGHTSIDYSQPPPVSIKVTEDGMLTLVRPPNDLFTHPLLERWAEAHGENSWQLTATSVGSAAKRGWTGAALIQALNQRAANDIPRLLQVAIRAWAGTRTPASLGLVTVLQFEDAELTTAIAESIRFKDLIEARLGPTALLVRTSAIASLREQLRWVGIVPTETR